MMKKSNVVTQFFWKKKMKPLELDRIICGNTLEVLKEMPDESVNCVITSPSYWALRDYKIEPLIWDDPGNCEHILQSNITKHDNLRFRPSENCNIGNFKKEEIYTNNKTQNAFCSKCGAWRGSLGLEPTFELYIKHLIQIFDEIKRVLRKDGTCWINIGDTYSGMKIGKTDKKVADYVKDSQKDLVKNCKEVSEKSLCLIPERFAIEMVNHGWILRNKIVWWKRNCMPSSVKDRFTVDWEMIFFFVKNKKYWFEQQYEPTLTFDNSVRNRDITKLNNTPGRSKMGGLKLNNYISRNMRCVWDIPTSPFKGSHFAVFPEDLVVPMIKAGCPEFVCRKYGKARERIIEIKNEGNIISINNKARDKRGTGVSNKSTLGDVSTIKNQYYTNCGCGEQFEGGIVLDPFAGAGTTCLVAKKLGRHYIGIDLNPDYVSMAQKRIEKECGNLL